MKGRFRLEELRLGLSAGAVGGLLVGLREALLTVDANTFVQPEQYFFAYLATPILACMALGAVLVLPIALARAVWSAEPTPAESLRVYGAVLGLGGALSVLVPWIGEVTARLQAVGMAVGFGTCLALWLLSGALSVGAAVATAGGAAWYATRVRRPLRYATPAALAIGILLLWPVERFLNTDWKWRFPQGSSTSYASEKPNVLLISIDTLRADHLGSYGSPHGLTPHLDRLAAEGVLYRQTITSSPWTLPAIASLFTGLSPHNHGAGVITNRRDPLGRSPLPAGSWTITRALSERGYRTHATVTNPYLSLRYGLGSGFETYESLTIESEFFLALRHTTLLRLLGWLRPDLVVGDRGETVSARATRWLERAEPGRPFFLWLHYIDPHPPYSRAGITRHKSFRSDSVLAPDTSDGVISTLTSPDVARLRSGEIRLSAEQKDAVRALYRAEVASVDASVGRVLERLDRLGLRERTLVICVADHGEEFWEHGGVEHGHTLYDELLRVPLVMRWPGRLPAGTRVEGVTRITDVAPTLLELLRLPAPETARDGTSLLPLIDGTERTTRVALSENLLFAEERLAIRTRDQKYIRWESGKEETYDLTGDPGELRDLAGVLAFVSPLRKVADAVEGSMPTPSQAARTTSTGGSTRALRALGYVQ